MGKLTDKALFTSVFALRGFAAATAAESEELEISPWRETAGGLRYLSSRLSGWRLSAGG